LFILDQVHIISDLINLLQIASLDELPWIRVPDQAATIIIFSN